MKKIGIVTNYYHNQNFGGQLQAYALQKYISLHNFDVEEISVTRSRKKTYSRRLKKLKPVTFASRTISKIQYKFLTKNKDVKALIEQRNYLFKSFEDSIPHTPPIDISNLDGFSGNYDAMIVGSDNVWRPESSFDRAVFLDFGDKKQYRMSYAASVGVSMLTEDEKQTFRQELSRFDSISVREMSSQPLLQPLTEKPIQCVTDPTFLIDGSEWKSLEKKVVLPEKYIFLYFVDDNTEIKKKIHTYAKAKGMSVVGIPHTQKRYKKSDDLYIDIPVYTCGPREWLYLIHNAELVFTDSFHGTVFSIIYKKPFWSVSKDTRDTPFGDCRVFDLLTKLGIESRILTDDVEYESVIDYRHVDTNLNPWIEESKKYLIENLNIISEMTPFSQKQWEAYAFKNLNNSGSSSGAAFPAIEKILRKKFPNLVVYGAKFNDDFEVIHSRAASTNESISFRGSKYVVSDMKGVLSQIADDLRDGLPVLFSGTPCQAGAVRSYIRKREIDDNQLFVLDLCCHGTPSKEIWVSYLKWLEKRHHSKIKQFNFRLKNRKTEDSVKCKFQNGKLITKSEANVYMNLFRKNYSLQKCCYQCIYANNRIKRDSDLTLSDFWGIEHVMKTFPYKKDVSLIIVHTKKGQEIIRNIMEADSKEDDLRIMRCSNQDYLKYNKHLIIPSEKPKNLVEFWDDFNKKGFDHIARRYAGFNIKGIIVDTAKYVARNTGLKERLIKFSIYMVKNESDRKKLKTNKRN